MHIEGSFARVRKLGTISGLNVFPAKGVLALLAFLVLSTSLPAQTYVFKSKFGQIGTGGGGEFFQPRAVAVAPNGDIVVADTLNNRIPIFDSSGSFKGETFGTVQGPFNRSGFNSPKLASFLIHKVYIKCLGACPEDLY